MTEQAKDAIAANVAELMARYSFDLEGYGLDRWIELWLRQYPMEWLPKAVIEALYQGRYKAVSVWQLLELWSRRGRPVQHFSREFERMISGRSLQLLFSEPTPRQALVSTSKPVLIAADVNGNQATSGNGNLIKAEQFQRKREQILAASNASAASGASLILPTQLHAARPSAQPSIQPFKPSHQFKLTLPGEIRRASAHSPIQQFVPTPESSEIHDKLKAIAHSLLMSNAEAASAAIETAKQAEAEPTSPQTEVEEVDPMIEDETT